MEDNKFVKAWMNEATKTYTENGATAFNSTLDDCLDLFSVAGALRSRPESDICGKLQNAYLESPELTTKTIFYTRDVREGLGERKVGRIMMNWLAENHPEVMKANLHLLPEYGRWDDVVQLLNTPVKEDALKLIENQMEKDVDALKNGESVSLLGKWLPSPNTSSAESRHNAKIIYKALGLDEKTYRKALKALRSAANVVEQQMSAKEFDQIDYEKVPSRAMKLYGRAGHSFLKNDAERFIEYKNEVTAGTKKVNAGTLYPYDLIHEYTGGIPYRWRELPNTEDDLIEAQWKALPDYVDGQKSVLVMADTSGSMYGQPMEVATGLAIYFAERNQSALHNKFMTFSRHPSFISLRDGSSLLEKIDQVRRADWGGNTDLEAAFDAVLNLAVENNLESKDLPQTIAVISDMEIDECSDINHWGFYDAMKARYEEAGYEIPTIVFWNVDARNDVVHARADTKGVMLCSGASPSVFQSLIDDNFKEPTPKEFMESVLNSERYEPVVVPGVSAKYDDGTGVH